MRKGWLTLAVLLALLPAAAPALTLQAGEIVPFAENVITVQTEEAGTLRLTPELYDIPLMPLAENLPVEAGTTEICWDGLSWYGEPLPAGRIRLRGILTDAGGQSREETTVLKVRQPLCAAVSCLPTADSFCPAEKKSLRIECGLSRKGTVKLDIARAEDPDRPVRTLKGTAKSTVPVQLKWDGRDSRKRLAEPGEYLLTAYTDTCPERRETARIRVTEEPAEELTLFETGPLLPEDPENDEAVWRALTAPLVVGAGSEGQGLYLMKKKKYSPAGSISCRTAGVRVLEICPDGWVRIGAWRQGIGEYLEGYTWWEKLTVIPPRNRYGVVISKQKQTMTVYENGKPIGTIRISTGLVRNGALLAATPPGVYLVGSRMKDFQNDGFHYDYPIRLHGDYLMHTAGFRVRDGMRSYGTELEALGRPASHGCIRMDIRPAEDAGGLNAWWIWTHLERDTRVIVLADDGDL